MTTELLEAPVTEIAVYTPFYADLAKLEKDNELAAFDYESPKGNKEARSHVYKLRQTKGALEKVRKEAKAESLRIGRSIDSEAADIEKRIEAMIVVHQTKLDMIEKREQDRIAAIQYRIGAIETAVPMLETIGSEDLAAGIAELELIAIDDSFAEFAPVAAKAKDARLIKLRETLSVIKAREEAARELARLRAEAEARAQADRDAAIAKAAEDRAKAEAEQLAAAQAKKAAQAIAEAEAKATAEREAASRRELELKLAAENAERRRVESEQKAAQDAKDAEARAEQSRLKAIQDEKDRVSAQAKAEADAQAKREANKAHLAKVNRAALAALVAGGIAEDCAKACITLIASGKIPSVQINY